MKNIEIDEELYQYIAANTRYIGESASTILRRLLAFESTPSENVIVAAKAEQLEVSPQVTKQISVKDDVVKAVAPEVENTDNQESVFNFINKEELAMQRGAVGRFLLILAALYRAHAAHFSVVTEICGRDRLYFAQSEAELAASGSSTKPKQIPESPFWVMTNSNTTRKKMMLTKAASSLGYNQVDVEKIRELL